MGPRDKIGNATTRKSKIDLMTGVILEKKRDQLKGTTYLVNVLLDRELIAGFEGNSTNGHFRSELDLEQRRESQ